ncbi:hypothetical protein E2C01_035641 [Portunus trituberculatus]|uniref:Uncharacterized protein n=1 Tax=Portunus trituberculatus TaxID=210409 RepID=A0A5B7FAA7_PORTR|nr:hypothetical protein [Portunus trituberculatus]
MILGRNINIMFSNKSNHKPYLSECSAFFLLSLMVKKFSLV